MEYEGKAEYQVKAERAAGFNKAPPWIEVIYDANPHLRDHAWTRFYSQNYRREIIIVWALSNVTTKPIAQAVEVFSTNGVKIGEGWY